MTAKITAFPRKSLAIGGLTLANRAVLAPMSGITDAPFRRLATQLGAGLVVSEMTACAALARGKREARRRSEGQGVGIHVVQLAGCEARWMAEGARIAETEGADIIDINMGCPARMVTNGASGSALMRDLDHALSLIDATVGAVRVPVTLKMRRGMDDSAESERNFFAVLDAAFETGLAAVTVHGRTVKQRYVGPSDWAFLARVKRHVGDRTILGSGDLFSAADCVRMLEETGVDGCSIARGAIGNPFIFREVRALLFGEELPPPSIAEQRRALDRHFELAAALHGEEMAGPLLRKFGVRYSELHPQSGDVKTAFLSVRSPGDWGAMLDRWYGDDALYPPVVRRTRPEALVAAGATLTGEG